MFHPLLPESTVTAINKLGFGVVDKIFIDFGASTEAAKASPNGFAQQGLAGGSNGDQSKAVQPSALSKSNSPTSTAEHAEPLGQKEVISYSLLWKHDQQEFEPKSGLPVGGAQENRQQASADAATGTINKASHNGSQTASKGAGDKTPETHVIVFTERANRSSSGMHASASEHEAGELPCWAKGVYTLRFAGSEFVQDSQSDAAAASNRCGVMWITGGFAESMESASDADLQTGIKAILQTFPALQLPTDFRIHRSVWGSDPLFKGSYSYGGATATGQECQALSKPLCKPDTKTPVVLFAGEACHPKYIGCTHGAYLTGESQAKILLDAYSSNV